MSGTQIADEDIVFVFHCWKEAWRVDERMGRVREFYPTSRVLLISDGDDDPELPKIAEKHSAEFTAGERLKLAQHGGKWWIRMMTLFLAGRGEVMIKLDSDSVMHRRFALWPDDTIDYFGQIFRFPRVERIQAVGGFCKGLRRSAAVKLLDSKIFEDPLYKEHKAARYKGNIFCEDFTSSHVAHRVGLRLGDWPEVRNLGGSNKPIPSDSLLAVTHPHKRDSLNQATKAETPEITHSVQKARPVKPSSRWSIKPSECVILTQFCVQNELKSALEFGPGASTHALLAAGCDPIYSYEDNPTFVHEAREKFAQADAVTILHYTESKSLDLGGAPVPFEERLDVAVVDAPVGKLYKKFSRINTLLFAAQHAKNIILHDAQRPAEKASIEVMLELGWKWTLLCKNMGVFTR